MFVKFLRSTLLSLILCMSFVCLAEPITLRFVCWDGAEGLECILNAARSFEKAHPGITVKVESVTANYQEKLLAQYAAHIAPDVAMMDPGNFQRFAKRDALLPMNAFFGDIPGFDISTYYKEIVDAHSYKGQLYVLPRDIAPMGIIYYNKRAFMEAGIPFPDGSWTWDFEERPELREKDFLWVMHHLTKTDAKGRVTQYGFSPIGEIDFAKLCYYSLGANEGDDRESPTKLLYNDPRIVKSFQFVSDLGTKKHWLPTGLELSSDLQSTSVQLFTSGRAAMYMSGIWDVPACRREIKGRFDWDVAMAPAYKDGTLKMPTGGSGYCVMSSTKHPKEAWQLTAWMAGAPGMLELAKFGTAQPAIRELARQEPWIPGPHTPEQYQMPHNRIITDLAVPHVVFGPNSIEWPDANGRAIQNQQRIFEGTEPAETTFRRDNQMAQDRLDYLLRTEVLPKFNWYIGACVGLLILLGLAAFVYGPELGKKVTNRQKRENRAGYAFILPWIIGLLAFTAGPMILSFLMSFTDWDIIRPARFRGFANYGEAMMIDPNFWLSLKVTGLYTIVSVPLGIIVALSLALLLNAKVRGMPIFRTLFYLPSLASGVAASLIWRKIFMPHGGLLNLFIYGPDGHWNTFGLATLLKPLATANGEVNWLGNESTALPALVIMSLWGAGGGMVIMLAGLQGIPQFFYEAATMDGAGPLQKFKAVTLPLLSPTLLFSMITGLIGSFQVFTQAFMMTQGGPNNATLFYMLHLYNNAFLNLRMGYASAMAWFLFFIILLLTLVQLRLSKWVYYEGAK